MQVEKKVGSSYFAYMIAVFTVLCNITTVGLGMLAENVTGDPSYITQCAAGFSGRHEIRIYIKDRIYSSY